MINLTLNMSKNMGREIKTRPVREKVHRNVSLFCFYTTLVGVPVVLDLTIRN